MYIKNIWNRLYRDTENQIIAYQNHFVKKPGEDIVFSWCFVTSDGGCTSAGTDNWKGRELDITDKSVIK